MPTRTRTLAAPRPSLAPVWAALAALALAGSISAARGQSPTASDAAPPPTSPNTPAEITPTHPAVGDHVVPGQGGSGPQTVVPQPLPPGTADTPGGSARGGVIAPPSTAGDPGINRGAPSTGPMPVIPPPGSPGSGSPVVPR